MADSIPTKSVPVCPLCGSDGSILYEQLEDSVFGAPGKWSLQRCRNNKCQLIWLNPCPIEEEMHRAYKSYYTHASPSPAAASRSVSFIDPLRRLYRAIREQYVASRFGYPSSSSDGFLANLAFLNPAGTDAFAVDGMFLPAPRQGRDRLLEVGCGEGSSVERMRLRGWRVEGVESDLACVELIERRGIKCHTGDLRQLALEDGAYDAIYMGNVIEHVYDPSGFLTECFRILKSGGVIVLITPNAKSWGHKHFRRDWRGLEPPRHLQIFDFNNITHLSEKAGFVSWKVRTSNRGSWYILGTSARIRAARLRHLDKCEPAPGVLSPSGLLYAIWGRLRLIRQPWSGEELVITACKP